MAPVRAPIFTVQPITSLRRENFIKICAYGKYGSGKSTLAASAVDVPSMRDVIIISAEGGEMSLLDNDRVLAPQFVDRIRVTSFKQLSAIADFLTAHVTLRDQGNDEKLRAIQDQVFTFEEGADNRLRKFKTVVVDSLSEINDMCLADLMGMHAGYSLNAEVPTPEFKEYKQNFTKMQMLVRRLRDLNLNVIIITAADWDQDETKKYHYMPALTGQLAGKIQGFFDIVGFLETGSATEAGDAPRRLWIQPVGGRFEAKNRLARCKKAYFDNPTMTTIMREAFASK